MGKADPLFRAKGVELRQAIERQQRFREPELIKAQTVPRHGRDRIAIVAAVLVQTQQQGLVMMPNDSGRRKRFGTVHSRILPRCGRVSKAGGCPSLVKQRTDWQLGSKIGLCARTAAGAQY